MRSASTPPHWPPSRPIWSARCSCSFGVGRAGRCRRWVLPNGNFWSGCWPPAGSRVELPSKQVFPGGVLAEASDAGLRLTRRRAGRVSRGREARAGARGFAGAVCVCHWLCQCPRWNFSVEGTFRQTMNHRQVGVLVSAGHLEVVSGRRPFPVHGAPQSPRRTGLLWMYSRDKEMASIEKYRFRSKPGPSCQNRKHVFPGRSSTVSLDNSDEPSLAKISLICFENGCLIRAR